MSELPLLDIATLSVNVIILVFIGFYFIQLRNKEKEWERKNAKADGEYHQIVDNALSKERKIIEDATAEANQIISGAQYISQTSKEALNQALQKLVTDIHQGASTSAQEFLHNYQESLKQLSNQSLGDFKSVTKELETDMQNQIKSFRESLIPQMEKELAAYKENRMKEAEAAINRIIQRVSQEILHKSVSLEDHEKLILESLEKAKKEGIFG